MHKQKIVQHTSIISQSNFPELLPVTQSIVRGFNDRILINQMETEKKLIVFRSYKIRKSLDLQLFYLSKMQGLRAH